MKIGILTLPLNVNYGGIMQAYALQFFLRKNGYDAEHIELRSTMHVDDPVLPRFIKYPVRLLKKIFINHAIVVRSEYKTNKTIRYTQKYTRPFINKNLKVRYVGSYSEIHEDEYDAFIVGSDQVWRPEYINNIENVFLDFASSWNIKRIAYAVSFGKDTLSFTDFQKSRSADVLCNQLSQKFSAISVREESGIVVCKQFFGMKSVCVLDPTLLLNQSDYDALISEAMPTRKAEIMCYVLDESSIISDIINRVGEDLNLIPVTANKSQVQNTQIPLEKRIQPPLEKWLCGFRDSAAVVTDSFHACVFSIIYNKPFIVVGNKDRGLARFENLLLKFGLESRLIDERTDLTTVCQLLSTAPNVLNRLEEHRKSSIDFLVSALNA